MDEKDRVIVKAFITNSKIPIVEIADALGITETAVRKRIRKLEENRVIKGYTVIVDPYFVGYETVAFVGVDTRPERILTVLKRLKEMQETKNLALTTGDHMIMFEVWCKDPKELAEFIKKVESVDGVTRVCPAIYVKRME